MSLKLFFENRLEVVKRNEIKNKVIWENLCLMLNLMDFISVSESLATNP